MRTTYCLPFFLALFACAPEPEPLDPSSYDRTCTQNSDCVSNTLQLEACVCASVIAALSDEGFADYQADLAALDRDCTPFEDAIECVTPQPQGPPVCTGGQCETTSEGGCSGECRGVDDEG